MAGIGGFRRKISVLYRRLEMAGHRRYQRLKHAVPLQRKHFLSAFVLLAMFLVQAHLTPTWLAYTLVTVFGVVLSTDYQLLNAVGFTGVYEWIQRSETLLEIVERNYYASQCVDSDDLSREIRLTYWEDGNFRAVVDGDVPMKEGIRFIVKVSAESPTGNYHVPVQLCSAELTDVSATDDGRQEIRLAAVQWFGGNAEDAYEQINYEKYLRQIRDSSSDIEPFLTVDESQELGQLDTEEWGQLYKWLRELNIS